MNTAAKVAREKAAHPERFCPHARCLWRTGGGFCPRHRQAAPLKAEQPRHTTGGGKCPACAAEAAEVCKDCGRSHAGAPCDPAALAHALIRPRPFSCSCRDCGARAEANGHVFGGGTAPDAHLESAYDDAQGAE